MRSSLYQINTRVWLTELSNGLGRAATLDDVPDAVLDALAARGFEWIWLLSVWQNGEAGPQLARRWRHEYEQVLPDLTDADIAGSGFAIAGYSVHPALGGDGALARIRERLRRRGMRLMLDFVPNHTALDHPWVTAHPEYYVSGSDADLAREPHNYVRVKGRILAHGRDPHFPGWSDTLQLDYRNPATQEAMASELAGIAERCDGVRCDMAMLLLPEVFARTWGGEAAAFWPAAIQRARRLAPAFSLLAEVYWDLERTLLDQGFDYVYDKGLYDLLREGNAPGVRDHLRARADIGSRLAHFLENHDEPRAAVAFARAVHEAAAIVTFLSPGLRFFHQGQFQGRRARVPAQLVRAPIEAADHDLERFYGALLEILRQASADDTLNLLECVSASHASTADNFLAWTWSDGSGGHRVVVVNYAPFSGRCRVRVPRPDANARTLRFVDLMGPAQFEVCADELAAHGLVLEMPAWGYHVFALR